MTILDQSEGWKFGSGQQSILSVDGFSDGLHRIDEFVNHSMNVLRAYFFRGGEDEPVQIDPEEIPDHGINGVRKIIPQARSRLMKGMGSGTAS